MILARMRGGSSIALNPKYITRIEKVDYYDLQDGVEAHIHGCYVNIEGSNWTYTIEHPFDEFVKAVDAHGKTDGSISLVEGITL